MADSSIRHNKRFSDSIEGLITNVSKIHYIEKTSNRLRLMNLFSEFDATWTDDFSDMKLIVKITDKFDYIINKLDSEFTVYELKEFTQIRSTYSKIVYRLLKQWRTIGKKKYAIDEFKTLLDTPDYYNPSEIDKNILGPVLRELPSFFNNLKVNKIKANTRGTPVIAYKFTWTPEKLKKWINNKYGKCSLKKEFLPSWANDQAKTDKPLSEEAHKELQVKLKRIRK